MPRGSCNSRFQRQNFLALKPSFVEFCHLYRKKVEGTLIRVGVFIRINMVDDMTSLTAISMKIIGPQAEANYLECLQQYKTFVRRKKNSLISGFPTYPSNLMRCKFFFSLWTKHLLFADRLLWPAVGKKIN